MSSLIKTSLIAPFICSLIIAQSYDVVLEKKTGHNGWTSGWGTAYVVKNDIVTVAIVPELGGRVMQYDLGSHQSIYVHNGNQVPSSGNDLVGGFRVLPSPQSDFVWPSPPNLDFNPYTCTELVNSTDSVVIYLESRIEDSNDPEYATHKGLQFKRTITLYKASTRVKVDMTMLNKGTQTVEHGIWDITQSGCKAGSDYWIYFERNPSSNLGGAKGYVQYIHEGTDATQWKPDVAQGNIMGVQYLKKVGKIGADCKAGWIGFVDRTNGYAYVKTFTYQENKTYPDSGASVQVYTYQDYDLVEVEVLGPLEQLSPNDSVKLEENWYATRSSGPILSVNSAGLITKHLAAEQTEDTLNLTGNFGLFYPGIVRAVFTDSSGGQIGIADSITVSPIDSLVLTKKYQILPGAINLYLESFDNSGRSVGILDSVKIPSPLPITRAGKYKAIQSHKTQFTVNCKYGKLYLDISCNGSYRLNLFSIQGKLLGSLIGDGPCFRTITVPWNAAGLFVVHIEYAGRKEQKTVILN